MTTKRNEKLAAWNDGYKAGQKDLLDKVFTLLTEELGIDDELATYVLEKVDK